MTQAADEVSLETSAERIYFLTQSKLYELVYTFVNVRDERGEVQEVSKWQGQFVGPLQELPMQGPQVATMADNVNCSAATIIHLTYTSSYLTVGANKCMPTRIGDSEARLPTQVLFIVPCYTTAAMHERLEQEGPGWELSRWRMYGQQRGAMPPQPSEAVQERDGTPLFDVFSMETKWKSFEGRPTTRLSHEEALDLARYLARSEGAIILRYYCEPTPPEGRAFDSLEWLNPHYVPWRERRGFYFGRVGGGYFETGNVIELVGERGNETVPAELFLVTVYGVEQVGREDEESVARPFGSREESLAWLGSIAHKKATLKRYVPDKGKALWFWDREDRLLNEDAFVQEGPTEWLD
jgi:hypothetical protein